MKPRVRPHWPVLVRPAHAPDGEESSLTPLQIALLDEYRARTEKPGHDPYDTTGTAREAASVLDRVPRRG